MFVGHLGSFGVGEVKFNRYRSGWGRECKDGRMWGVRGAKSKLVRAVWFFRKISHW